MSGLAAPHAECQSSPPPTPPILVNGLHAVV